MKPYKRKITDNFLLEEVYKRNGNGRGGLNKSEITGLAKRLDWSERQVERWYDICCIFNFPPVCHQANLSLFRIRRRKQQKTPPTLVKFTETGWMFTYFAFASCYGLWALWDKPWLWGAQECWTDYPHQVIMNTPLGKIYLYQEEMGYIEVY